MPKHSPDFTTRRIPVTRRKRSIEPIAKHRRIFARVLLVMVFVFIAVTAGSGAYVYFAYLADLPSIRTLEAQNFPESSIIYDREGNELYNLYTEEKRRYVRYDDISTHMIDAIVSAEDKTFFENRGVDFRGLARSGLDYLTGKTERISGTSTISQQLIRNVFLTNERSVERKLKEMYLSFLMTSTYSKEQVLEMYLNKISFGSNAYGVEQAARTFFAATAGELDVLQSAILASIPKWPTSYSPYTQRERLMGGAYLVRSTEQSASRDFLLSKENPDIYAPYTEALFTFLTNLRFSRVDGDSVRLCGIEETALDREFGIREGCALLDYSELLSFLNAIRIDESNLRGIDLPEEIRGHSIEYDTGRKDFVLGRMLEDDRITSAEYINALIDSVRFSFEPYRENIIHPHFVFYVQEYLEDQYGPEFLKQGGLHIHTTLDPDLQSEAERIIDERAEINSERYDARDAGLVSIDNETGQIVAMVGGANYFAEREGANVNIITSTRQPGSSFKPIVYALAFAKEAVGDKTPVYDIPTKFGDWEPENFDGKFLGKISVAQALGASRNIPAAKMFSVAGDESDIVTFSKTLGISSLDEGTTYGNPLAIGTGELEPLELARAYSVFANLGLKRETTPILRIEDQRGNTLERFIPDRGSQVFSAPAAYILTEILADPAYRPGDFWKQSLSIPDHIVAAKTGTSNMQTQQDGRETILPRDLWTVGYSRYYTTVVWTGNVDGEPANIQATGLSCAAPIWKTYMEFAHESLDQREFERPEELRTATISAITGKLATSATPVNQRVSSMFAVEPEEFENVGEEVSVDILCDGRVTSATPSDAIHRWYLMDMDPVIEHHEDSWLSDAHAYIRENTALNPGTAPSSPLIFRYDPDRSCPRPISRLSQIEVSTNFEDGSTRPIGANFVQIAYRADNPIIRLELYRNNSLVHTIPIPEQREGVYVDEDMQFGAEFRGEHEIRVRAIDRYYYAGETSVEVRFDRDTTAPVITTKNPASGDRGISVYDDQFFNLRFQVTDPSPVIAVNLYLDGELFRILGAGRDFSLPINEARDFDIGTYRLGIEAVDAARNRGYEEIELRVLPQ